jgi:isopentenyl-diphosphate delta-isomerase
MAVESEIIEENYAGIKNAAKRRIKQELGYDVNDVKKMKVIQKVLYQAKSCDKWGESEVDYVIFLKSNFPEKFDFNEDEVDSV